MMQGAGHGITFESPMSQDKDSLVGFAFIYGTTIVELYLTKNETTIEYVYIRMQKSIDRWEGVLNSTGGAIRPYK